MEVFFCDFQYEDVQIPFEKNLDINQTWNSSSEQRSVTPKSSSASSIIDMDDSASGSNDTTSEFYKSQSYYSEEPTDPRNIKSSDEKKTGQCIQ